MVVMMITIAVAVAETDAGHDGLDEVYYHIKPAVVVPVEKEESRESG